MRTSDDVVEIATALISARGAINNPHKTKEGYGYKYAPLDTIIDEIMPKLLTNGIVVIQSLSCSEARDLGVTTRLQHTSGQFIEDTFFPPSAKLEGSAKGNPIQEAGAAITYARRYALGAMLCIAPDEDTDAKGYATGSAKKGNKRVPVASTQGTGDQPNV